MVCFRDCARASLFGLVLGCGPGGGDSRGETDATGTTTTTTTTTTTAGTTAEGSSGSSGAPTTGATSEGSGTLGTTSGVSASSTGQSSSEATTAPPKLDVGVPEPDPIPVKEIPGLVSITFYETTGDIKQYTFTVDGPELNTLLPDPLSNANRDIEGTSVEFYDVYYSDIDGVFDPNGSYLTIAGAFGAKLPAGGGLNLAEISLNYMDGVEYGSFLASFVGLGDNYVPGSEPNAIDGDLATHTTMGNTVDTPDQRLRVTLGFKSSLMPG